MPYDPDRRRIRKNELATRRGCTPRTVDNHVARGVLPQPHRDELGRPFWWSDEIAQHESRLEQREAAAA